MIRDYIYNMPIVISIIGIISIIWAIKNKDKKTNKLLITFNIVNMIYLFTNNHVIPELLPINLDIVILLIWGVSAIGGFFYLISLIICVCKGGKVEDNSEKKINSKAVKGLLLVPIILFIAVLCREEYLLYNSEFIMAYHSNGNGGFGESYDFVYVINDKYCEEISIDADYSYEYLNRILLPKTIKKITENELNDKGYEVVLDDEYINVYKNQKLIHREKMNDAYYNSRLEDIFYTK